MFLIRRKRDGFFYRDNRWVKDITKARLFKNKTAIKLFLNYNNTTYYLEYNKPSKGLAYFEGLADSRNLRVTPESDFEVVEYELKEVKR